jgi:hypothetical protein
MSKIRFRLGALFLLTVLGALALSAYRYWPVEGIFGYGLSVVFGEDTEWAGGYTDEGWRVVRIGMNEADVHSLLGPPLYVVWDRGGTVTTHWWTRSPSNGDYRERAVVFFGDKSVEKISGYWVD